MTLSPDEQKMRELIDHMVTKHHYREEDLTVGRPINLADLRWLHAPWLKTREYPQGCRRI